MQQDIKLLPIANIDGREFLVDFENRELRDFNGSESSVVKMHSREGRELIRQMQDMEWRSLGISTGGNRGMEV